MFLSKLGNSYPYKVLMLNVLLALTRIMTIEAIVIYTRQRHRVQYIARIFIELKHCVIFHEFP